MTLFLAARLDLHFRDSKRNKTDKTTPPISSQQPPLLCSSKTKHHRKDGVRPSRQASKSEAIQILRRRPLAALALRPQALLHPLCHKMLPHVDGPEPDHPDRLQLRHHKRADAAVVYADAGSGLSELGVL